MNRQNNSIWKNYQFMALWIGSMISSISISFYSIALPIIVYRISQSTLAMSTLRAIEIFPNIILGMLIGVLVDRFNRKYFMAISVLVQSGVILGIIILMYLSDLLLWELYVLGFIFYTFNYAFSNAFHSTVPLIVTKEQLVSANSIRTLSNTLISIMAPAIAGIFLFSFEYQISLIITLVGYFLLFAIIMFNPLPDNSSYRTNSKKSFWNEMLDGWRFLLEAKVMWILTLIILFINIASSASGGVLIFFSVDVLNLTEKDLGLVLSMSAVGGILGSIVAKKTKDILGVKKTFLLTLVFAIVGQFVLFQATNIILLSIAMFLTGFSVTVINIHYHSLRQALTPAELLGRVSGTANMITMLATPFAYLTAGLAGEFIEVRYIFLTSTIILIIITFRFTVLKVKDLNY